MSSFPGTAKDVEGLLMTIARSLPLLRTLDLFADLGMPAQPRIVRGFLETCSQELEILSLNIDFCRSKPSDEYERILAGPIPGSKAHPKLRLFTLTIQQDTEHAACIVPLVLVGFLQGCDNLETVFDCIPCCKQERSWMIDSPDIFKTLRGVLGNYHFK
ncbi:hypothetical protein BGX29_004031 [Mortierella sp. GBA35]|nr:hypothetical protein BGX29_004031 [Mortierella sp. GBA35]